MVKGQKLNAAYPYDRWKIIEDKFDIENNFKNETIFALGNGYIGFRGDFEENYRWDPGAGSCGTYLNGFYETKDICYGESFYGNVNKGQTMLNVTNGKIIKLYIEDEEFDMRKGSIIEYSRVLDLREGILKRHVLWCSDSGKKIGIDITRLVSFTNKYLAAIRYEVTPLNFSGKVSMASYLDGDVKNRSEGNDPRVGSGFSKRVLKPMGCTANGSSGEIIESTVNSGFSLACAMENEATASCEYSIKNACSELKCGVIYDFAAQKDCPIVLDKFIAYAASRDFDENDIADMARGIAEKAQKEGFIKILNDQHEFMKEFWYRADVTIEGDDAIQQGIRFNMFHLLQSAGRDGKTNIAAKGLTGEGYEGHYFWDTETYILPFFVYTFPSIARKFLEYRYNTLDEARERAGQMAVKGALFPWRTIDGRECSAYYPAGTAQYHIDADIAFAVKKYMESTDDIGFLVSCGAEILFETARMWGSLGDFIEHKGNKFCINCVTGPDEYTAIVNNNYYTNLMARENLNYAFDTAVWLEKNKPEEFKALSQKIGLSREEVLFWKKAADNMYLPQDDKLNIFLQDDAFLDRAPWDFENTPEDKYPLLLYYHPLVIYRHQVCKQADLVLALYLLSHKFSVDEIKRNLNFYERFTTHDSSLSECVFSIVSSEAGYFDKAYKYFIDTARMDLDDSQGNTKDGVHTANMAGAWLCVVNGFAGMRVHDGMLEFSPHLPEEWESYSFRVTYKSRLLQVSISREAVKYELLEGEKLEIFDRGKKIILKRLK